MEEKDEYLKQRSCELTESLKKGVKEGGQWPPWPPEGPNYRSSENEIKIARKKRKASRETRLMGNSPLFVIFHFFQPQNKRASCGSIQHSARGQASLQRRGFWIDGAGRTHQGFSAPPPVLLHLTSNNREDDARRPSAFAGNAWRSNKKKNIGNNSNDDKNNVNPEKNKY